MSETRVDNYSHIGEPIHISVSKNSKGDFQYEVSYYDQEPERCFSIVKEVVSKLEEAYGKPK